MTGFIVTSVEPSVHYTIHCIKQQWEKNIIKTFRKYSTFTWEIIQIFIYDSWKTKEFENLQYECLQRFPQKCRAKNVPKCGRLSVLKMLYREKHSRNMIRTHYNTLLHDWNTKLFWPFLIICVIFECGNPRILERKYFVFCIFKY